MTLLDDEAMSGDGLIDIGPNTFEWTTAPRRVEWASSDPRLSGIGYVSEHGVQHTPSYTGLRSEFWNLSIDGGSWRGTGDSFSSPRGARGFVVLLGAGGYEGLTAYMAMDEFEAEDTDFLQLEGVVVPEPPPSLPNQ